MMVSVTAYRKNPAGQWCIDKTVECADKDAQEYVKMFFDLGYEKVMVN